MNYDSGVSNKSSHFFNVSYNVFLSFEHTISIFMWRETHLNERFWMKSFSNKKLIYLYSIIYLSIISFYTFLLYYIIFCPNWKNTSFMYVKLF